MAAEPFDHHAHGSRKRMDVRVSSGSASMRAAELVKPHSASASNYPDRNARPLLLDAHLKLGGDNAKRIKSMANVAAEITPAAPLSAAACECLTTRNQEDDLLSLSPRSYLRGYCHSSTDLGAARPSRSSLPPLKVASSSL